MRAMFHIFMAVLVSFSMVVCKGSSDKAEDAIQQQHSLDSTEDNLGTKSSVNNKRYVSWRPPYDDEVAWATEPIFKGKRIAPDFELLNTRSDLDKRSWQDASKVWGKRGDWQDASSVWGKRDNSNAWLSSMGMWGKKKSDTQEADVAADDKRAGWQDASTMWGKRNVGLNEDSDSLEKRGSWQDGANVWGKRDDWLDGSTLWGKRGNWQDGATVWGKRAGWQDRATVWGKRGSWQDASGLWGKRANPNWQQQQGSTLWGKRAGSKWQDVPGLWGKRGGGWSHMNLALGRRSEAGLKKN